MKGEQGVLKNNSESYGAVARTLHWTMAALIGCQIALGLCSASLGRESVARSQILGFHKSLGVLLLYLVLVRLWWTFYCPPPPHLDSTVWRRRVASGAHATLYALLVVAPLSGALMSLGSGREVSLFGLLPWPRAIAQNPGLSPREQPVYLAASLAHKILTWGLIGVVTLHLGAVIKHHLLDRDPRFLRRMTGR